MRKADPDLREKRRLQIIEAATACFVANGFHQTSMQQIAAETGLSMGLLYRYFASKEEIIDAAARIDRDALIAAVDAMPSQGRVIDGWVELVIKTVLELIEPSMARLVNEVLAEAGRNGRLLAELREHDRLLVAAIARTLHRQQRAAAISTQADVDACAVNLMVLIDGWVARHLMQPDISAARMERLIRSAVLVVFGMMPVANP